jgi:sulfate permease, SulP family
VPTDRRSLLERRLPIIGWVRRSDGISRRADLVAGLTVAAMLVPQGMAYAALAGMPPVTGLYASTVPLVVYALLGTSGQLAVGPVAIVSLLTASTIAPLADGDPGAYVALAGLLALLVGAIQVGLGLLRAGRLTDLLSHAVISGFTSAAAIVIATSQLDKLLGVSIGTPRAGPPASAPSSAELGGTHLPTLAVGLVAIAALVLGRKLGNRVPTPLLVVAFATAAVPLFGLEAAGVAVLGEVPGGVPAPDPADRPDRRGHRAAARRGDHRGPVLPRGHQRRPRHRGPDPGPHRPRPGAGRLRRGEPRRRGACRPSRSPVGSRAPR